MTLRDQLLAVAAVYQEGHGLTATTVSNHLFANSRRLADLRRNEEPSDVLTANWERAIAVMSLRWPEGALWPEQVFRPGEREAYHWLHKAKAILPSVPA